VATRYVFFPSTPSWSFTLSTIFARPFEPAQSSPGALGAQAELVDHRKHSVAGQTSFRAIGPRRTVAKLDSIMFELRMRIQCSVGKS